MINAYTESMDDVIRRNQQLLNELETVSEQLINNEVMLAVLKGGKDHD